MEADRERNNVDSQSSSYLFVPKPLLVFCRHKTAVPCVRVCERVYVCVCLWQCLCVCVCVCVWLTAPRCIFVSPPHYYHIFHYIIHYVVLCIYYMDALHTHHVSCITHAPHVSCLMHQHTEPRIHQPTSTHARTHAHTHTRTHARKHTRASNTLTHTRV